MLNNFLEFNNHDKLLTIVLIYILYNLLKEGKNQAQKLFIHICTCKIVI